MDEETALFTQRPYFESLCTYAFVMKSLPDSDGKCH